MPHRTFDLEEVARYLHLERADVERLVKNQDIPLEKHGQRVVFRKIDIDAWASQRILGLEGRPLDEYHQKTSSDARPFLAHEAEKTGRLLDPQGLLAGLEAREALCSTGLPGGLALLHARVPDAYVVESPFIALGRTIQEIPFGAPDVGATDLFFLLGCPDDRLHLHTLARLCMMAQKTDILAQLRAASEAASMYQSILDAEDAVLGSSRSKGVGRDSLSAKR
jgi:excisionase family DNA binding protein